MTSTSCIQPFFASFEQNFSDESDTIKALRKKCWQRFFDMGLPTKKHEDFQFMKLEELPNKTFGQAPKVSPKIEPATGPRIVFVNGYFMQEMSVLPKGVICTPLKTAFKSYSVLLANRYNKHVLDDHDPFAMLNAACAYDGAFLYLPPKFVGSIEIVSVIDADQSWIMPRLQVFVSKFAEVEFVARTVHMQGSENFYNACFDFELDDESKVNLTHADLATNSTHGYRFDAFRATLKRNSRFTAIQLTDSEKSRRDWRIILAGEAAEADLSGLWFLDSNKETHTNVSIEHQEPYTRSLQLFKGVLDDESLSSFQGKILVRKKAQKTQAYQLNNNLLLSDKASANSKPNLEIFADDVKASHGATTGQLDTEQLFYLKTRGMDISLARGLLIRGFCEEVIAKVTNEAIRHEAEAHLKARYNIVVGT